MKMTSTQIAPNIGLEIRGVSGHDLVDRDAADACLAALTQHAVVVYPEIYIDDNDLVAFSRLLGEVVAGGAQAEEAARSLCNRHAWRAGEQNEPRSVAATTRRTGGRLPSERTTTSSRRPTSARSGMKETPIPAATKPWMAL